MAKNKKPQKLKPRLPRGFVDRDAGDIRSVNEMIRKIGEVYEKYGFDPIETPMFEYTDCLGKFLPDADRPNDGVFSIQDDDEQWMSLRYDLTAPLARHVAEQFNEIQMPFRTYRAGYVFRNEKPGPGRFRQFMQMDADSVGAPGVQADAEMCMMMADTMEALGIARGDYVVRVNNRKVLDGVMEAIGLGGDENVAKRLDVMRAIDKLDRLGFEGVRELLGEGRKDESGDFTDGVGLDENQITLLERLFYLKTEERKEFQRKDYFSNVPEPEMLKDDEELKFKSDSYESKSGTRILGAHDTIFTVLDTLERNSTLEAGEKELRQLSDLVRAAGYGTKRIRLDTSIVRGLEYYTGMVYEVELTFPVTNEKGQEVVFGSVGGGGRYDGLVSRFRGEPVPATGFSIGVSRLMTALKNLGKLDTSEIIAPVLVTVMDASEMGTYQKLVQELRGAGIRAEMYMGNPKKFGKQLQYADRRGCPVVIIQGEDERATGEIQIKDMIEGKRLSAEIEDNVTWRESRPAQISVSEGDLVAKVREILDAQEEDRAKGAAE